MLESADSLALPALENCGTIDRPDVRFSIRSGNVTNVTRTGFEQTMRKVLGLDRDPDALQRLADVDPALRSTTLAYILGEFWYAPPAARHLS